MHPQVKIVILGLTNSGKSTVSAVLKDKNWFIVEVDDIAQYKNKGVWPEDEDLLDKLFKEVNEEVLKLNNVIFVTSFLEIKDLERFHEAGFKIIELHASYDELVRRKVQRDGAPQDNYERFNRNYKNYQNMLPLMKDHLSLSLDTTGVKSEEIARTIEKFIS
jgi:RNase adaptor protein for sRNA GlmZ degradation